MSRQDKYVTRGINAEVDIMMQLYMWQMIENIPVKKDYLQVFNIRPIKEDNESYTEITIIQEEPSWQKKVKVKASVEKPLKIFVIDDKTHTTMLLAEEY